MAIGRRTAVLASATILLGSAAAVPATAAATPAASNTVAVTTESGARIQVSCPSGDVCFWNKSWQRCNWNVADPNWSGGNIRCSWAKTRNVHYVWNRGTSSRYTGVVYYLKTNYRNRVGCTRQGKSGYLQGTYKVDSHKWTSGRCG
ncbi:hypothetical protein [Streptomyces halobius]|uniref:Peptidase inhibitor family I36 n=1 Tax=Streptomyces halobius TaxID=2879846 RepID=A0ABY4MAU3_9ACTN|nr:hypothetical protein [Streptomyces halobius]UQA94815.1 hypothetical protein K9S39_25790 [Streptomyces halobius]